MSLYDTFNIHKETVLFSEGGFNVKCVLKPSPSHKGYNLNGFSSFTGCTFSKDGEAFFGDTFELTINLQALQKYTEATPIRGWLVAVEFPQLNYKWLDFTIENAPIDRTLGTILLRCSAVNEKTGRSAYGSCNLPRHERGGQALKVPQGDDVSCKGSALHNLTAKASPAYADKDKTYKTTRQSGGI